MSEEEVREPLTICLCGSTRFKAAFGLACKTLGRMGVITLSVDEFLHADSTWQDMSAGQEYMIKKLHYRKMDMADAVLVIDVGLTRPQHIGDSTRLEIKYARDQGTPVYSLSDYVNMEDAPTPTEDSMRNGLIDVIQVAGNQTGVSPVRLTDYERNNLDEVAPDLHNDPDDASTTHTIEVTEEE